MESKFFVTKTNIEDDIRDRRDDRIEKVTYLLCRDICSPLTFDHDLPHIPILVAFITSVTHPTFSHFVGPYEILPQLPIFPLRSSFSLLIIWPNKVAWHLQILLIFITSYLFVPAFRIYFSFDFFAVHEIRSNLLGGHVSVASSFFCSCFVIVQQTSRPCTLV